MPKFQSTLPDGRKIVVDAPDAQSAAEGAATWAQQNPAKPKIDFSDERYHGPTDPAALAAGVRQAMGIPANAPRKQSAYDKARAREDKIVAPKKGPFGDYGGDASFSSMLTAPFNGELHAGLAYLGQGAENLYRQATGQDIEIPAGVAAKAAEDATDAAQARYRQEHPGRAMAAELLGGLTAGPGKAVTAAPSLLKSTAAAAGLGGVYGGFDAPDGQRLEGAALGAATGAGINAGLHVGGKLLTAPLKAGVNAVADRLQPTLTPGVAPRASRQAARYVARKAAAAGTLDTLGAAPTPFDKPLTAAEAIGKPGEVALKTLARRDGATAQAADGFFAQRGADTANRIVDDVATLTGTDPALAAGNIEGMIEQGRATAKPLFDAVRANPEPIVHPDLQSVAKRPVVQRALRSVYDDFLNAGVDPEARGLKLVTRQQPGGGRIDEHVEVTGPTADTWDSVYKAVSRQVERNPVTGKPLPDTQSQGNYGVGQATKALGEAMRQHVPGWGQAMDSAGDYMSVSGAFDRAKGRLFSTKTTPADVAKLVASAKTPAELNGIRHAVASDLFDKAQNGQLNPNLLLKGTATRQKLAHVFGQDAADQIAARLEVEAGMLNAGRRIRPGNGSPTAEISEEIRAQDGVNPLAGIVSDVAHHGPKGAAVKGLAKGLDTFMAGFATPGMSIPVRDEAGRLLMLTPEELAQHLGQARMNRAPLRLRAPQGVVGASAPMLTRDSAASAGGSR
jgi:hypothetical protein